MRPTRSADARACDASDPRTAARAWLALLSHPPAVGLTTAQQLAATRLARLVEAALACVLQRPVHLVPDEESETPAGEAALVSVLRWADQRAVLWLDQAAARALVWPVLEELGGLAACGPLSETERGVLQYVLLATGDKLAAACGPAGVAVAFDQVAEPADWPAADAIRLTATLRCGTLVGRVAVQFDPQALLRLPAAQALMDDEADAPASLEVALELPAIPLCEAELRAIEPGDCLLLDAREVEDLAGRCAVVTQTGWRLADVEALDDGPTFAAARCGRWDPRPIANASPGHAHPLRVRLGAASLTASQIERWDEGRRLCFTKNAEAPVLLVHEGRQIGAGELVRCDGVLAVRVVNWSLPCTASQAPAAEHSQDTPGESEPSVGDETPGDEPAAACSDV